MLDRYPHEFSGGMRQRAVIAMALSCSPQVIIADEPTTALDVIVQDQILKELKRIQAELGMSIIYISHDIAVIAEVTDSMGSCTPASWSSTAHPRRVLPARSIRTPTCCSGPRRRSPGRGASSPRSSGEPPDLLHPPTGCRFHPRCPFATEKCTVDEPPLEEVLPGHQVACWHWEEVPVLEEALRR